MISRITGIFLVLVFLVGYFSEIDLCDKKEPAPQIQTGISFENPYEHNYKDKAPLDDCSEGAPCQGHCHFGHCISVTLIVPPRIFILLSETEFKSSFSPPSSGDYLIEHFRPPIA